MDKICISCHYVGVGESPSKYRSSIIVFYAVLTIICIFIAIRYPFAFILVFLFFAIFLDQIANYLKERDTCPECKELSLIPVHLPEAKQIIQNIGIEAEIDVPKALNIKNKMRDLKYQRIRICKECLKHVVGDSNTRCNIYGALIFIFGGIISISLGIFNPYTIIGSGLLLTLGLISLFNCIVESDRCPACNKISMISIESDAAKELIKMHNIKVPTNTYRLKTTILKRDPGVIVFVGTLVLLVFILYKLYGYFSTL